jgi:hypothetical protein
METPESPQQAPCCMKICRSAEQPTEKPVLKSIQQKEPGATKEPHDNVFGIFDNMLFYY